VHTRRARQDLGDSAPFALLAAHVDDVELDAGVLELRLGDSGRAETRQEDVDVVGLVPARHDLIQLLQIAAGEQSMPLGVRQSIPDDAPTKLYEERKRMGCALGNGIQDDQIFGLRDDAVRGRIAPDGLNVRRQRFIDLVRLSMV
jgi:hypothetical protein